VAEDSYTNDSKAATAAIRIVSGELSAAEIADGIGLRPSYAHSRGDSLASQKRIATESLCLFGSELPDSAALEEHLRWAVRLLDQHRKRLVDLTGRCTLELVCSFSSSSGQGGVVIEHRVLKSLAAMPIDVVIDLFPPTSAGELAVDF